MLDCCNACSVSFIMLKHCICKCFRQRRVQSETTHVAANQARSACLQESIPDRAPPPRPQLLAALKKCFLAYEEKRNSLLSEEDSEAVPSVGADAGQAASCSDKHEKCPFWASIVRHKLAGYLVRLY